MADLNVTVQNGSISIAIGGADQLQPLLTAAAATVAQAEGMVAELAPFQEQVQTLTVAYSIAQSARDFAFPVRSPVTKRVAGGFLKTGEFATYLPPLFPEKSLPLSYMGDDVRALLPPLACIAAGSSASGWALAIRSPTTKRVAGGWLSTGQFKFNVAPLGPDGNPLVDSSGGGRDNSIYLLALVVDTAGKFQIELVDRVTSAAIWTTTGTGNKSNPTFGYGNIVRYFDDAGGSMIEMYVPIAGGAPRPVLPNNILSTLGDSLTESHPIDTGSPPNSWQMMLSAMLGGVTVNNYGIQGQTSIEIAARQGGAPSLLTVTGNQIPASGSVVVTAYSVDLLYNVGVVTGSPSLTGTLAGIPGTLTTSVSNARGGTYTFTRTSSGSAAACSANTPFIPDLGVAHAGDIQSYIYGRNNPVLADILASLAASVGYLTPLSRRFFVGSVLNQLTETIGTAGYNGIASINAGIRAAYPDNYVDLASPPTPDEIAWVTANYGYVLTSQDSTDIANGTFPTGMRPTGDITHLNIYWYAIWARRIFNFLTAKGWLVR
jgi:hypothetical protein